MTLYSSFLVKSSWIFQYSMTHFRGTVTLFIQDSLVELKEGAVSLFLSSVSLDLSVLYRTGFSPFKVYCVSLLCQTHCKTEIIHEDNLLIRLVQTFTMSRPYNLYIPLTNLYFYSRKFWFNTVPTKSDKICFIIAINTLWFILSRSKTMKTKKFFRSRGCLFLHILTLRVYYNATLMTTV